MFGLPLEHRRCSIFPGRRQSENAYALFKSVSEGVAVSSQPDSLGTSLPETNVHVIRGHGALGNRAGADPDQDDRLLVGSAVPALGELPAGSGDKILLTGQLRTLRLP